MSNVITCEKCGKELKGEFFVTAYGEKRCPDCYDDYLMTDKGKVEYLIGICQGAYPVSDFDADFLGHVAVCWKKYRDHLNMTAKECRHLEFYAEHIGIL